MPTNAISGGTAHRIPLDMQKALTKSKVSLTAWESLTPLSRNEWICWSISVKKEETRKEHIERMVSELKEGKRRPCCWIGCIHRKDKELSPSIKGILEKRSTKR
jgi:hypothetical protein